ncbi:putative disease resistance RPP13-like protein 1 [Vitis vinifera]|uniref:Putative disease resistance RPP13-like protein 1 n=1 Tax=Vitis vinifera TaxID=29760 RepID=A0A438CLU1_VITVI|nr:putative disease resistance RPP13-like protein 1 [Vitis vinifera]
MAAALVGGAFLSASLQVLFDRLASREVVKFIRGHELDDALLKKLKRKLRLSMLSTMQDRSCGHPDSMSTWVHPPLDIQSINSRVEEIIGRLDDIAQDRDVLGLKEGVGEKLAQRWPSTSLGDESLVYGRAQIKEEMVQLLLSDNARSTDAMGVISIVGMGGTGKTTLAQLLYNDQRVKEHFEIKAWVCVSEEFDPIRVKKTILEAINSSMSNTTDLNLLQVQLKERINMKNFLLVLDDVWNEDSCDWDTLRTPLIVGAKGSKIIVTTRSTNVAFAMRAVHTRCLGGLSSEDGWSLFKKLAFENGNSSGHPQLEAIGEKIVHKCQGLPLAIKAMGSLLHSKVETREWDDILNSELWDLPTDAVLPALRMDILSSLQPHTNLKRLHINSFSGLSFPDWVGDPSFFNLVDLGLQNLNFMGNASSSNTIKPSFPSLQTLRFGKMYNWEKWLCCGCRRGEFPRLQELCINECPKLTGKLPKQLRSLKKLVIIGCELLVGSLQAPQIRGWKMSKLQKLKFQTSLNLKNCHHEYRC